MKASIGILAWNEEDVIGVSLDSLFRQTIFREVRERGGSVEVIVVPNGCSDRTAAVARERLARAASAGEAHGASLRVEELREPGKLNAWNEYVHRFCDAAADVVFLMDADIRLDPAETLWNMLRLLAEQPGVVVATDLPRKHIAFKRRKSLFDLFSLAVSSMTRSAPAQLTGQLYAIRASAARSIWMPRGLLVEDGFLKFMVTTAAFSGAQDDSRIARADNAGHVFEAYTRIREILQNQRRQAVGHTVYRRLREFLESAVPRGGVREFLGRMQRDDPDWFVEHLRARVARGGWWVMDSAALVMRFRRLRHMGPLRAVAFFPVAVAGFIFDLGILLWANAALRRGHVRGLWKDTKSKALGGGL